MTTPLPPTPPPAGSPAGQQPPPGPAAAPELRRSATDRMLGGVCGGLADRTGIDTVLWRVGFLALTLTGGSGILLYLLLWVLLPPAPATSGQEPNVLEGLVVRLHDSLYSALSRRG